MDWIEWLGIGLVAWLVLSLLIGLGITRLLAILMNANFESLDRALRG